MVILLFYRDDRNVLHDDEFIIKFLQNYQNSNAKIAFFVDIKTLNELNAACKCSNKFFEQVLFRAQASFSFDLLGSLLFDIIEDTLQHIIPFGIPQHFSEYHKWVLYGRYDKQTVKGPKVLTLKSLSFGFVLWLAACGISFLGFFMEHMHIKMRRHMRQLIGLTLFLMLLYTRLKTCAYL